MRQGTKPYPDLSGLSREEIVRQLKSLVFTARKDWRRSLWIDQDVRDMLVKALGEHSGEL